MAFLHRRRQNKQTNDFRCGTATMHKQYHHKLRSSAYIFKSTALPPPSDSACVESLRLRRRFDAHLAITQVFRPLPSFVLVFSVHSLPSLAVHDLVFTSRLHLPGESPPAFHCDGDYSFSASVSSRDSPRVDTWAVPLFRAVPLHQCHGGGPCIRNLCGGCDAFRHRIHLLSFSAAA